MTTPVRLIYRSSSRVVPREEITSFAALKRAAVRAFNLRGRVYLTFVDSERDVITLGETDAELADALAQARDAGLDALEVTVTATDGSADSDDGFEFVNFEAAPSSVAESEASSVVPPPAQLGYVLSTGSYSEVETDQDAATLPDEEPAAPPPPAEVGQDTEPLLGEGRAGVGAGAETEAEVRKVEEESKAEAPKVVDAPKVEEEPKAEEPKAEEPKAEEPDVEAPKVEAPQVEEPKVEECKAEEPEAKEPVPEPSPRTQTQAQTQTHIQLTPIPAAFVAAPLADESNVRAVLEKLNSDAVVRAVVGAVADSRTDASASTSSTSTSTPPPSTPVTHDATCDWCAASPLIAARSEAAGTRSASGAIVGVRYKSTRLEDYDVCETCEASGEADERAAPFIKIRHPRFAPKHVLCVLPQDFAADADGPRNWRDPVAREFFEFTKAKKQQQQQQRPPAPPPPPPPAAAGSVTATATPPPPPPPPPATGAPPPPPPRASAPAPAPVTVPVPIVALPAGPVTYPAVPPPPQPIPAMTPPPRATVVAAAAAAAAAAGTPQPAPAPAPSKAPLSCPGNHELSRFHTAHGNFVCNVCEARQKPWTIMFGCRVCDWDCCAGCWNKAAARQAAVPSAAGASASAAAPAAAPAAAQAPPAPPAPRPAPQAKFVCDLTVHDGAQVRTGERIVKTWRIKNSSLTEPWPPATRLVHVGGEALSGPVDGVPVPQVRPGELVDVSVPLVMPDAPGRYTSYWRLATGAPTNARFGHRFWVTVNVARAEPVAVAVAPVPVPAPVPAPMPVPSAPAAEVAPLDDETRAAVEQIVDFGFNDVERVVAVLREVDGDVSRAIDRLLESA